VVSSIPGTADKTNKTLGTIEGDAVSSDNKYLCDNGDKYLKVSMSTSFPTNTTENYSLRLVKTVKVKLQSTEGQ
jgi:hypothetical protein